MSDGSTTRPRRVGRRPVRRRLVAWLGAVLVVLLAAAGGLALAYPNVAAAGCPGCFGLTRARPGLYLERGLTAGQRQEVVDAVDEGARRVAAFYGGRVSSPRVLACRTAGCYRRIGGGGERGIAVLNRVVLLSPRGLDPVIAAHELSHVELHARLGGGAGRVPRWFDEGLAVLVSADERYLLPGPAADRCRVAPEGPVPGAATEWLRAADPGVLTYAVNGCRVSRWVAANGGDRAVLDLIDALNRGERFAALVEG